MARAIYTLIFYLALPIIVLRLLWRSVKAPAYAKRWSERFGSFASPAFSKKVIWLHTVSVGETIAAAPLVKMLLERGDCELVITTMTPTGSAEVQRRFGDTVFHVYAPYDIPLFINRFLNKIKPALFIVMETELWPNTIACCQRRKIPAILANGRLSAKSAKGYQRFSFITRPMLRALDNTVMQYSADAERIIALGAAPAHTVVSGSIKFDISIEESTRLQAAALKTLCEKQQRQVLLAASTHKGEDQIILDIYKALSAQIKNLLLVLVPRHPERFNDVIDIAKKFGQVQKRSDQVPLENSTDILIGDTMGELFMLMGAADVVFMGGTLVPNGGHNFIEPAIWGVPIVSGESVFNFSQISEMLRERGGLFISDEQKVLQEKIALLLKDQKQRSMAGAAARDVAMENRGALNKLYTTIAAHLD